jgi:pimeloyl-ACP methyl ester carboxylesterase
MALAAAATFPALGFADYPVLTTGFVESGGEQIYYETVGSGDAVVLCHGLGGNHAIWYQQVPVLAGQYQVVTWDQRGFGRSSNATAENSPASAAVDLGAVLDHLGIHRAHLVGQSMGGWAVMGFALAHPERVRSIVLADTLGGIFTPEASAHFDAYIRDMMTQPPPEEQPFTRHPAIGEQLGAADPAKAFLYRQIGGLGGPAPRNAGLQLRQTSYPIDAVRSVNIPALFVVGEHDPIFPPAVIRSVAAEIPGARVIELPGAGHSPYFETPAAWNHAVTAFLAELSD